MSKLSVKAFQTENQVAVKELILAGMVEYWGEIDSSLNPDLNDIATSYKDAVFLVAWLEDEIVGTGAFILEPNGTAQIVRMSVASHQRRKGIANKILEQLVIEAKNLGLQKLILETNSTWTGAINFYKNFGFRITHEEQGDFGSETFFALDIS